MTNDHLRQRLPNRRFRRLVPAAVAAVTLAASAPFALPPPLTRTGRRARRPRSRSRRGRSPRCRRRTRPAAIRRRIWRDLVPHNRSGKLVAMRLDHGGLLVSDVERAVRFYTDALGLTEIPRPPTFDTPGAWLAGRRAPPDPPDRRDRGRPRGRDEPGVRPGGDRDRLRQPPRARRRRPRRAARRGRASTASSRAARSSPAATACAARSSPTPTGNMIELMETGVAVTGAEPRLTAPQRNG